MKKIYYLKTCDTCKRILKQLPLDGFELQEIKTQPITVQQLEEMHAASGSYEALFSRQDYKQLILQEYTFLKRPVVLIDDSIFIGNSKKNVEALISFFES